MNFVRLSAGWIFWIGRFTVMYARGFSPRVQVWWHR